MIASQQLTKRKLTIACVCIREITRAFESVSEEDRWPNKGKPAPFNHFCRYRVKYQN